MYTTIVQKPMDTDVARVLSRNGIVNVTVRTEIPLSRSSGKFPFGAYEKRSHQGTHKGTYDASPLNRWLRG